LIEEERVEIAHFEGAETAGDASRDGHCQALFDRAAEHHGETELVHRRSPQARALRRTW
jgi:hypothetical protein